ncbi:hypothetical protein THAOC_19165 [Thalassiosira oceanica]|uniref:DNA polymerase delta subunit 3 n=1 Tax=Thalassiosira oceanica TaxID=159749 RepID=K0S2Z3_THAOC|nr:hypothetical protein THAOC_19165 [Thalassiosira oceanica]|eukprot:EJK60478.1 hypothetical protein THAOC_19165 [Thalassiosira oceanica]
MATSYEPHQLDQIRSLLEDQRECITLRCIMLELSVNRRVARQILARLVNDAAGSPPGDGTRYTVVRMLPRKNADGKTRMELVAGGAEGVPFSIAVDDSAGDGSNDGEPMDEDEVDGDGNPIVIAPGDPRKAGGAARSSSSSWRPMSGDRGHLLQVRQEEASWRGRRLRLLEGGGSGPKFPEAKSKKGKPTTAEAFFGSATTKKKKDKKKPAVENNKKGGQKENNGSSEKKAASAPSSARAKAKGGGNVDDFVGDVDEDDEFEQMEVKRKARKDTEAKADEKAGKRRQKNKKKVIEEEEDDEDEEMEDAKPAAKADDISDDEIEYDDVIDVSGKSGRKKSVMSKGALNAYTAKKAPSPAATAAPGGEGSKKRRKRLVEQTTTDENGFFKTEFVAVWEEVEDEGDGASSARNSGVAKGGAAGKAAPAKKGAKAGGKGKKQAGLMGFFAKKK